MACGPQMGAGCSSTCAESPALSSHPLHPLAPKTVSANFDSSGCSQRASSLPSGTRAGLSKYWQLRQCPHFPFSILLLGVGVDLDILHLELLSLPSRCRKLIRAAGVGWKTSPVSDPNGIAPAASGRSRQR